MISSSCLPISFFFCIFSDFILYIKPLIWTAIIGAIAIIAITPNAAFIIFTSSCVAIPIAKGTKNVDAIVPDATPPESNATAVNISEPINARIIDNKYPGI